MPGPAKATLLLVEDDPSQRRTLAGFLRKRGYQVLEAASAAEAEALATPGLRVLLTDLRLGGPDGVALLQALRRGLPDLQAIVVTAYGTVDDAVRAMRAGAYDFVAKPVDLDRLEALIEKALERVTLAEENRGLKEEIARSSGVFSELVGESQSIQRAKELALKVAPSKASVLILGESGTGKEVLARAIHRASPRRTRPFVSVNCAALSETLIESELFGHEKGAFTGAAAVRKGRFELADGGTIFLDEVGDIPLPVQVKLLGVVQSGRFERVGGTETRTVDVRILAATHRDLGELIKAGRFREDLFYRLNVVAIELPALRERPEDIALLVEHFLRLHADLTGGRPLEVSAEVRERLRRWPFPGNVRELENWIERAVVLADGGVLGRADFPPQLFDEASASGRMVVPAAAGTSLDAQVETLERALISAALERHGGNKSAAARELGLTERAIRYKLQKYGL